MPRGNGLWKKLVSINRLDVEYGRGVYSVGRHNWCMVMFVDCLASVE